MSKNEQELWLKHLKILVQKKHLEEFLLIFKKSKEFNKQANRDYKQVAFDVKNQISDLALSLVSIEKLVEDVRHRLELPNCKNNIVLVTHQILQANSALC